MYLDKMRSNSYHLLGFILFLSENVYINNYVQRVLYYDIYTLSAKDPMNFL